MKQNVLISFGTLLLFVFCTIGHAQHLSGPDPVELGINYTYTFNDGNSRPGGVWEVTGGIVMSTSSSGTDYFAIVQWNVLGLGDVAFKDRNDVVLDNMAVTVNPPTPVVVTALNYVHNITPRTATTDITTLTNGEKIEAINYFDGLGRAKQSVAIRAGGNSEDIITPIEYDPYGRMVREYLPYSATTNIGSYRSDALTKVLDHYDASAYDDDFPGMTTVDINPYSEKEFDNSPLNRVMKQAAPGKDWKLGNGHEIEMDYLTNTSATEVRRYDVALSKNTTNGVVTYVPTLSTGGHYAVHELIKTVTRDENHPGTATKDHTTEEFKDKQGWVVLKRTYDNGVAHDTYYAYDDFGNLSFVLPPKAEAHVDKPDATELSELCYQYKYDEHNRLVEKKIPGKGWEYIVYNILDQPILTRDANLGAQTRWLFTKYDVFGRVAYTGYITSGSTRTALQNAANAVTTTHVTKLGNASTLAGTTIYYSNNGYPTTNISEIYTINYYDNYTFDLAGGSSDTAYGVTPETNVKGLATGSKVRVLGTDDWITTVTYYDDKSRPIYVYSNNDYIKTTDKVKSDLSFDGTVTETTATHARIGYNTITIVDRFTYDHTNRLLDHRQKINSAALDEVLAANTYDDLGQLTSKGVGGKQNTTRLQQVDYDYNVRGWLRTINDPASLGSDLFGFKINYNTQDHGGTLLYNGNIAETAWKTASDNLLRRYRYEYDALNRFTAGVFNTGSGNQPNRYSVSNIDYDKNGNITALQRNGHENAAATAFGDMDNLVYTYETKSNRLKKVLDNGEDNFGFKDGANLTTEYTYDANGNMLTDLNKGISSNILYNHLDLPTQVTLSGGNIQYIYDATGVKQKKIVSTGTTTDYAGNFIYENGTLKMFSYPDGYAEPPAGNAKRGSEYKYAYQYKDHLGNIRLTYSDSDKSGSIDSSTEIIEENNYYPFGLQHKGYNDVVSANVNSVAQKFKYNGKELQDDDVNGNSLDWHDYGARNYDASLGRWMNLDPMSEFYYYSSTFTYAANNPLSYIDPNGMWVVNITGGYDTNGNYIYSLNFTAEGGDDLSSLSTQLGISVKDILYAHPELRNLAISEGTSLGLGQLEEVSVINTAMNTVAQKQDDWNCANFAGGSNCSDTRDQYNTGENHNNIEDLADDLKTDYDSVTESETKIGAIIHFRIDKSDSRAMPSARNEAKKTFIQQMRQNGLSDAQIVGALKDPKVQTDIENYALAILTNERHFAVVILKTKDGKSVQNILQKSGTKHFNFDKVDTMEDTSGIIPYKPSPVKGTKNPYYNRKN
ncbi:DUF6443 domain-containing protein [Winogradskyella sp.]|uniref:DUF6443 domain-containing protein n=1 Tax=Winogradskyella sp. TaxID=1883156 RepID=UPI003BA86843